MTTKYTQPGVAFSREPGVKDFLVAKATRMSEIGDRLGLSNLARTIVDDTHRRLDDVRVRVAVIGEIKQGKSTLVNALVGRNVLPVGVTPTTGASVVVRVGAEPGPWLVHDDGQREHLDDDRFVRTVRTGRITESQSEDDVATSESLEYVLEGDALPPELELVDTPGVNDMSRLRGALGRGELPRADILVLVLDATQLLNRAEMAFLRDAIVAVGGLENSGARLLLAVNRIDLIAERERPKLLEHLERELADVVRGERPSDVHPVVSPYEVFLTDARTAARDRSATTAGVQGVRDLRARLLELAAARSEMLPLRARASLLRFGTLLGHNAAVAAHAISLESRAVRADVAEIEAALSHHDADMTAIRKTMASAREALLAETGARVEDFTERLRKSVDAFVPTASQRALSTHLAAAIHDAFLVFVSEEAERLRTSLDEITRQAIHTRSEQVRRRLFHATLRLGFQGPTIFIDPPSLAMEAGFVTIGIAGTAIMYFGNVYAGMAMAVAGPLMTVVLREKSIRDARARVRTELPGALERAGQAVRDQVRKVVDGHLAALDEHLLLANVALREQLTGVLERALEDLGPDESDPAAVHRRTKAQLELRELELELATLRSDLQSFGSA